MPLDKTTTRSWFRAQRSDDGNAEITIYDEIGAWGITAKDLHEELRAIGSVPKIYVRINSPGGEVFDALAIHNMLQRHRAFIEVSIDGIAASSASLVAMAGDVVRMPGNAMMMIHDPGGVVVGRSREMRDLADALDKVKQAMIAAYSAKSGRDGEELAALMEDETWLTAKEAVELGLADEVVEPVRIAAKFDLARRYRHPPNGLTAHRREDQAMSQKKGATAATAQQPEQQQPDQNNPEQQPGEQQPPQPQPQPQQPAQPQQPQQPAQQPPPQQPPQQPTGAAAQAIAAERARTGEILAACSLVGRHDLAAGFVADGKTVGEVVNALQELRVQGSAGAGGEINTRNASGGGGAAQAGPLRVDIVADMRRRAGVKGG
jgi:ATP-dependent Clp protease, protease subunit